MKNLLAAAVAVAFLVGAVAGRGEDNGKLLLFFDGDLVGEESYSLHKAANGWELNGSGHAQLGPLPVTIEEYRVVTDEEFNAVEAEAKANLGQVTMHVKTTFAGGEAVTETPGPDGPEVRRVAVPAGIVVVSENLPVFPFAILARRVRVDTTAPQRFTGWILGQKAVPLSVEFKGRVDAKCGIENETLNHFAASLTSLGGDPIAAHVWTDDRRRIIHMIVPSRAAEVWQAGCEPQRSETPPAAVK